MYYSAIPLALVFSTLLGLSARASAGCLACANCIYDPVLDASCLNYWTCADDTITCYYPSGEDPGTFTACAFELADGYFYLVGDAPELCDNYASIGDNSKCEPPNDPWNGACMAAEGYVGETSG